jgi:hypothetical protein
MKAGGADVRVLHLSAADSECCSRVRSWSSNVLGNPDPPHAFFAIAFWLDDRMTGGMDATSGWWSDRHELQYDMLPDYAQRVIRRQLAAQAAERNVMRNLGYTSDKDPAA